MKSTHESTLDALESLASAAMGRLPQGDDYDSSEEGMEFYGKVGDAVQFLADQGRPKLLAAFEAEEEKDEDAGKEQDEEEVTQ